MKLPRSSAVFSHRHAVTAVSVLLNVPSSMKSLVPFFGKRKPYGGFSQAVDKGFMKF